MPNPVFLMPYPISNNRYYRKYNNIMTLSKEGKAFKDTVRWAYHMIKPTDNNYALEIIIHPKLTKKNVAFKNVIDIDNVLKCALDSLIGILYIDDKQVIDLHVYYGEPIQNGGLSVLSQIIS